MKGLKDLFLPFSLQVDQDVLTTDHVKPGEGRVSEQVMGGKDANIPDRFYDLVASIHIDKKTVQPFRRDLLHGHLAISTGPRFFDRPFAEVRGEQLDRDDDR